MDLLCDVARVGDDEGGVGDRGVNSGYSVWMCETREELEHSMVCVYYGVSISVQMSMIVLGSEPLWCSRATLSRLLVVSAHWNESGSRDFDRSQGMWNDM